MSACSPTSSHASEGNDRKRASVPVSTDFPDSQSGVTASTDCGASSSNETANSSPVSMSRCLVYCRLRPANKLDFGEGSFNLVTLDDKRVVVKDERHYDFDGTFPASSTQEDVFDTVAVPCIQHAFNGFCAALMCYGQTGTGKSFTMCNTEAGKEGIIPRAASYIFDTISHKENTRVYTVDAQFVQIYRDHLGDLMTHDGKDRVEIHFDGKEGVSLTGCSTRTLTSTREFMKYYHEGNARRVVTATAMNPESSRGHTALCVTIASEDPTEPAKGRTRGRITFIDLAGYERFSKTGITSSNPVMKDEAKTINASLLALGHVVSSLSAGSKHIPWRNSKLTRILQDSIGARSRTSIILTIGPSSYHLYETTNSLQFGLRAMAVKVQAKVTVTVDYVKLAQKLMRLLDEKDARIGSLELQIASRGAERQELLGRYEQEREAMRERFEKDLAELKATGASEEQTDKLKEVYRVEAQNLQDQQNEEIGYQDEQHSKEMAQLINEQKHEEAKSLSAMKLAQERIVEDFQRKLESARGGTNEDLVQALKQLSEKDSILASRANDTARLHACIEALTAQIQSLGSTPATETSFPETFLDVSQVEEMQARLSAETERQRSKVVDLRAQLDRLTALSNDRAKELCRAQERADHLVATVHQLQSRQQGSDGVPCGDIGTTTGDMTVLDSSENAESEAEGQDSSSTSSSASVWGHWVDPAELETLRLSMQSDIDELRSQRDDLSAEVRRLTAENVRLRQQRRDEAAMAASGSGGTGGALALDGRDLRPSIGGLAAGGKVAAMQSGYKKMIQRLTTQLAESSKERSNLSNKVTSLKQLLHAQNMVDSSALSSPTSSDRLSHTFDGHQLPEAQAEEVAERRHAEALAAAGPDVALALTLKEAVIEAMKDIIVQQERHLDSALTRTRRDEQLLEALRAQLREAGVEPADSVGCDGATSAAVAAATIDLRATDGALPLEEYTALLREVRRENRSLLVRLLCRRRNTASGEEGATGGVSKAEVEAALDEKDGMLGLKDELVLEKGAMAQYLAKLAARLISQMEVLGLTPCCSLPQSYRELAESDTGMLAVQLEKQEELEQRLAQEEEKRRNVDRLLRAMNAEREHQACILQETEARNRELAERERQAAQLARKAMEERSTREIEMEDVARRTAQELIDVQAELAQRRQVAQHVGVFERLFGRFLE